MAERDWRRSRDAVRRAYEDGLTDPTSIGPWKPVIWGNREWRHWKKFSAITLDIAESMTHTLVIERGPDAGTGPRSRQVDVRTRTTHFSASVPYADVWRGQSPVPPGMSQWWHGSVTPWGEGLYDAGGQFSILGTVVQTDKLVSTFHPADGGDSSTSVINDVTTTNETSVVMSYSTDPADLAGLATPCRMTAGQSLHGPLESYFHDYATGAVVPFPPEHDPDGAVGAELYYTDTALASLAAGSWASGMVLTSGGAGGTFGPNLTGDDNGDMWEESYTRGGLLTLGIG
ncbi:MAG: hypothetical protein V4726_00805 [Verrucomicrobiota bacterium]